MKLPALLLNCPWPLVVANGSSHKQNKEAKSLTFGRKYTIEEGKRGQISSEVYINEWQTINTKRFAMRVEFPFDNRQAVR